MRAPISCLIACLALALAAACGGQEEPPSAQTSQPEGEGAPENEPPPVGETDQRNNSGGVTIEDMRAQAWAEIDEAGCREKGGEVVEAGMLGMPRCITPYADAGEACGDSSECEGRCLASDLPDDTTEMADVSGQCEADDSPFGCYAEVREGKSQGFLCVD